MKQYEPNYAPLGMSVPGPCVPTENTLDRFVDPNFDPTKTEQEMNSSALEGYLTHLNRSVQRPTAP